MGLGTILKGITYHGTTGGVRNALHSVGLVEEASNLSKLSTGGALRRAPLAVVMWPVNAVGHIFGGTIKGIRNVGGGYIGLWKNHPGKMALGTAVVGIPVAMSMLAADRQKKGRDHEADMAHIDQAQGQTGQVLGMLQMTEPAMPESAPRSDFSSLQQASPQIMAAASAMPEGKVTGPAAMQGVSA